MNTKELLWMRSCLKILIMEWIFGLRIWYNFHLFELYLFSDLVRMYFNQALLDSVQTRDFESLFCIEYKNG